MPDEQEKDSREDPGDAGPSPRTGGADAPAGNGGRAEAGGGDAGRKPAAVSGRDVKRTTPATVALMATATACAIALAVVFNVRPVRDGLEDHGLLWAAAAGLVLVFAFLAVLAIVREKIDLGYVRGLLESAVDANNRLRMLLEGGREIGSTLDMGEILEKLHRYASGVTGASMGAIYLYEKSGDVLRLAGVEGVDEQKVMFPELPMGKGLLGRVASKGQMVAIGDVGRVDERDNVFFGAAEPSSMVLVPLVARGKFLGMLVTANAEPHAYTTDEKLLLDGLAELAGLAITNAELYRIARKSLDALTRERGVKDSVLEEMVAGVITTDASGRIGVFNREAQRLTGYAFAEMTQRRLLPESSLDQNPLGPLEHGLLEVLENPSLVREGDALIMKSDRALLPVSYRIYPLVSGPEVVGSACVFMEARRPAPSADSGSVDYQVLLRSLGARVEHVYTHPLSRVIERMKGMDIDDWSRAREEITRTLGAGHSTLLGLLEDLEQYLNCTTTREWDRPAEYDLGAIVQKVVREVLAAAMADGVSVSVRMQPGMHKAFGYERMISSALAEVAENACTAASMGDMRVEITGRDEGNRVRVEVRDGGPGLTDESFRHMYMPFYTVWEGRSGLGLSLVKRVMAKLGGRVGASRLGDGATFFLEFPAAPGSDLEQGDEEGAVGAGGS